MKKTLAGVTAAPGAADAGTQSLGTLADIRLKSVKKVSGVKTSVSDLLDLDALGVTVESEEVIQQRILEAQQRSQFAQRAAKTIMQIGERRKQLTLIEEKGGTITSAHRLELEELDRKEQQILSYGDDELRAQVQFSLFIEEVRVAEPTREIALAILTRAIEMERYRIATIEEARAIRSHADRPAGTQFFDAHVYLSLLSGSPGQSALEAELRKYLKRVKQYMESAQDSVINAILRGGSHDLEQLRNGITGVYVLHLPERKVPGEATFHEGAALVSVEKKSLGREGGEMMIIKVVSGAGKLSWMSDHHGKWISLASFKRDKSDSNLSGDLLDFSDRLIRNLKAALSSWRKRPAEKR